MKSDADEALLEHVLPRMSSSIVPFPNWTSGHQATPSLHEHPAESVTPALVEGGHLPV